VSRNEARHGATRQALREAAVVFAAALELGNPIDLVKCWDALRKAAVRYARNPRRPGRPASLDLASGEGSR
jgi:hypothetical protein